jgi:protein-S-isoprenylcysteine O-methyltransferase Ste14
MTALHFIIGIGVLGGWVFLVAAVVLLISIDRVEIREEEENENERR